MVAEHKKRMEERLFRIYLADAAKCIAESWGATFYFSYADLINPHEEEEPETGDEVALDVIERLGLTPHGFNESEGDSVA